MTRNPRSVWPAPLDPDAVQTRPAARSTSIDYNFQKKARFILGALAVAILLLAVAIVALMFYVKQDHDYVQGRGRYRDAEQQQAQEQTKEDVRKAVCSLLDGLPASPLLDPTREEYNCGAGTDPGALTDQQKSDAGKIFGVDPNQYTPIPERPAQIPGDPWTYRNYDPTPKGSGSYSGADMDPVMPGFQASNPDGSDS